MNIINEEELPKGNRGKKIFNPVEQFLFEVVKEGKKKQTRLQYLIDMESGKAAIILLEEIKAYGSSAKATPGLDSSINKVFILGQLRLIAKGSGDKIIVRKLESINMATYSKSDLKPMPPSHLQIVKSKLDELFPVKGPDWGPED